MEPVKQGAAKSFFGEVQLGQRTAINCRIARDLGISKNTVLDNVKTKRDVA